MSQQFIDAKKANNAYIHLNALDAIDNLASIRSGLSMLDLSNLPVGYSQMQKESERRTLVSAVISDSSVASRKLHSVGVAQVAAGMLNADDMSVRNAVNADPRIAQFISNVDLSIDMPAVRQRSKASVIGTSVREWEDVWSDLLHPANKVLSQYDYDYPGWNNLPTMRIGTAVVHSIEGTLPVGLGVTVWTAEACTVELLRGLQNLGVIATTVANLESDLPSIVRAKGDNLSLRITLVGAPNPNHISFVKYRQPTYGAEDTSRTLSYVGSNVFPYDSVKIVTSLQQTILDYDDWCVTNSMTVRDKLLEAGSTVNYTVGELALINDPANKFASFNVLFSGGSVSDKLRLYSRWFIALQAQIYQMASDVRYAEYSYYNDS